MVFGCLANTTKVYGLDMQYGVKSMNKIQDPYQQLFTITMEECGELIQSCSKILRHGVSEQKLTNLVEEAGDVMCMIELLQEWDFVSYQDLEDRIQVKKDKLKKWSNLFPDKE